MSERGTELYLDLLARVLTRHGLEQVGPQVTPAPDSYGAHLVQLLQRETGAAELELREPLRFDAEAREVGRDWPLSADTMIGLRRLANVRMCTETVLREGVPGDLIETGVWRGGTCIYMRAILEAHGDPSRKVWVADSFAGLPPPDERYPADEGDILHTYAELAIPQSEVARRFAEYGLLDDRVVFLEGFFEHTLAGAPIEQIAVLRLDGDMYASTMVALEALYHKVSPGGFVIVDDYSSIPACAKATEDFRSREGIEDPIEEIDWTGVFWRKS